MTELGRLRRVRGISTVWSGEETVFTPWLAEPRNLAILAEALGLGSDGLEVLGVEVRLPGAGYRADILARIAGADEQAIVLIENQFGRSDHDHLGKLLTYASGLKARTVVLIGEEIRTEHRAALDWLNAITSADHAFFACEIELWQIGDSQIAPQFKVVVEPNDWRREATPVEPTGLSVVRERQRQYWEGFEALLGQVSKRVRPVRAQPANWIVHGLGRTGCQLNATVNFAEGWARGEIYLTGLNARDFYDQLLAQKDQIETEMKGPLDWYAEAAKDRRISRRNNFANAGEEAGWPEQHRWLASTLDDLHRVFSHRVRSLDLRRPSEGGDAHA